MEETLYHSLFVPHGLHDALFLVTIYHVLEELPNHHCLFYFLFDKVADTSKNLTSQTF